MATLIASLALLSVGCVAAALSLRLSLVGTAIAAYVVGSAEVVLLTELLSPFHAIGRAGYLAGTFVAAAAALVVWSRLGSPLPPRPRLEPRWARRHPLLVVLAVVVAAALGFELFLVTSTTPNEWDAMTYHLSRVAAWYQQGSLASFASHTARETVFPENAEIQSLFTVVASGGDRFVALPQFFAQLALLVSIFGTARRLGFARSNATFAALLFATLTEVALQATTAQNDLVVSAYLVAAVYFLLGRARWELWLAAASVALALGTKFTAVYALPVVATIAFCVLPRRLLVTLAAVFAVAFLVLGSRVYVSNALEHGTPLGPRDVREEFIPDLTAGGAASTAARVLWRFVDLSGSHANVHVRWRLAQIGESIFDALHIDPQSPGTTQYRFTFFPNIRANEDVSFFGLLGPFLILPLAFGYAGAWMLRRTSAVKGLLAAALPLVVVELALTYRYAESIGRFFVVPVALGAALAARAYTARLLSTVFVGFGVAFLAFALVRSEHKPVGLDGATPAWELSRPEAQALAMPELRVALETLGAVVPDDASVGYVLDVESWDYPLYGPRLSRRLVELDPRTSLRDAEELGLRWVVRSPATAPAPGWTGVSFAQPNWQLLTPAGGNEARQLIRYVRATPPPPGFARAAGHVVGGPA